MISFIMIVERVQPAEEAKSKLKRKVTFLVAGNKSFFRESQSLGWSLAAEHRARVSTLRPS